VEVPRPGDVVDGKYRIEKVLGGGGMGVVLAAHHQLLDQRVAMKVLTSSDPVAISRFSLEAKATAQLKSEHVARVMDVGTLAGGAPFMVMEYLEGCDLGELLRLHARLPVQEAVGYVLDALDGLAQAHALEIIHRDLKPANLFLAVQASGASIVKIVDFGISKSVASRRSGNTGVITADHSTVGSPTYMAPEQIRSPKDVDARSDVWAIGVVLYELLSGAAPFRGDSVGEIFASVLETRPPLLTSVVPEVPAGLSGVVARCMSRDPDRRYPDVLELAKELAPFGPPDSAARLTRIEQTVRAVKAKAEGKEGARITGRFSPATARAGAEEVTAERPQPGSPEARRRPQVATAGHVAFSSDTPRHLGTMPSLRRQVGRRRTLGVVAAGAACLAIALVAILRGGPAPVGATVTAPSTAGVPSPMPLPAPGTPSQAGAGSPAAVPQVALDELPSVQPRPSSTPRGAGPHRPRASPTQKKHIGVLDSPD
jgi:hypothetical protein